MATNEDCIDEQEIVKQEGETMEDFLAEYRRFYEKFVNIGESCDQLPVKVVGCLSLSENEVPGEILSYTLQYLDSIECPPGLITQICREVLEDTRKSLENESNLTSLVLMRAAVSSIHHCLQAGLDNEKACKLAKPPEAPRSTASASRNGLRCMEDRHVILDDFSGLLDSQESEPSSFYAVYDGHSGPLAAAYSAAQLHMHFINSEYYKTNPQYALKEAFNKTDLQFASKKSNGGTTAAVCYLKGNKLLVGWAGDSQALLVGDGSLIQLVNPHKPSREDEHKRIIQLGGQVIFSGIWRVNGILAVSRAIGDTSMKPYIISEPEFASVTLSGFEEFIVLACDGLWDYVSEDEVALEVYKAIEIYSGDIKKISDQLVKVAKQKGSVDNISVIVVFLQDIHKLAEKAKWLLNKFATMDASFDNTGGAQTNRFHVSSNQDPFSKEGLMFDLDTGFKRQNGEDSEPDLEPFPRPTNGKGSCTHLEDDMDEDEDDEDLGPETDVDAVDDVVMSPSLAAARALSQGSGTGCNDDMGVQRQETPTPPTDADVDADFGVSGLVENVGESGGEESEEDEWNYFKGDKKERNSIEDPSLLPAEDNHTETFPDNREDTMSSPLNPEAPPFVPVSPTGSVEGSCLPQRLLSEEVVAQSPQKPVPMDDIKVPEPQEFEDEISHRLADLGNDDEYHNGHSDNSAMSSQENLKEALQGNEKQLAGLSLGDGDQIDMQFGGASEAVVNPAEFDRVQKDTTDFCDIQVTYNQQTNQPYDDEGIDEELYERLKNKERDPMSMSFYQEKDLDTCEEGHNPFDLNAVQMVPNDLEEFCNDKPQAEVPPAFDGSNPFLDSTHNAEEVTQHEIHAAISDLDNAVTNESDSMDSIVKAPSPLLFEKANIDLSDLKESPISDNVSQMTEPSEHDPADQRDLLNVDEQDPAVVSHDSAFSTDAPSPVPSPIEAESDVCQITQCAPSDAQQPQLDAFIPEPVVQQEQMVQPESALIYSQPPTFSEKSEDLSDFTSPHDALTQFDNVISHPANESHIEHSSQFDEQPVLGHADNVPISPVPHPESPIHEPEIASAPHHDGFEYINDCAIQQTFNNLAEDACQFVQSSVTEQCQDDAANTIIDIQSAPEQIQSNIIDFRNDVTENNVTNETSQKLAVEDFILSQEKPKDVESTHVECLIDSVQEVLSEPCPQPTEPEHTPVEDVPAVAITPDPIQQLEELKSESEPIVCNNVDIALPAAGVIVGGLAGAAVVAAVSEAVEDKKTTPAKPKATTVTKKAPTTKPLTSPTKTSAPKTSTATKKPLSAPLKPAIASKTTSAPAPKSAPARPKTVASPATKAPVSKPATAAVPKPKPPIGTKTTTPTTEKKPLTNGDVKKEAIKKATPLTKPAAPKPSVPKSSISSTVASKTSVTAPRLASAAPKAPITKTTTSRPATAPAAPKPKPAPITKASLSSVSKTSTTIDKSAKEITNKQISARPTPAPRTALAPKTTLKTTTKTTTTTTTATKPFPIKRPTSATTKSKTSTTTVKSVTAEKVNGSVEKCVTQEMISNGTDIPLKDDSPQQVDNSLLPIIDAAAD